MPINDASTIAELAKSSVTVPAVLESPDSRRFLVIPQGFRAEEISDPYGLVKELPAYPVAAVALDSVESFCQFAIDFAGENSVVFGTFNDSTFTFLADYHSDAKTAGRCEFRASYALQPSTQWKIWSEVGKGSLLPQLDFLRFIEENQDDIIDPAQADLLEMLRDFHAVRTMSVSKSLRPQWGVERFEFRDETRTGAVDLPTKIRIFVPVYENTDPLGVDLFLRFKILDNDKLVLGLKIKTPELIERNLFRTVAERIKFGLPSTLRYYDGWAGGDFVGKLPLATQ